MKILSLQGRLKSNELERKILKLIDDIFIVALNKRLTESVLVDIDRCFQEGVRDKFNELGEIDPKIILTLSKDGLGILEFTPGNLWTLAFLNGYYVSPLLISKDTEELILGTESFRFPKRNKFNLNL